MNQMVVTAQFKLFVNHEKPTNRPKTANRCLHPQSLVLKIIQGVKAKMQHFLKLLYKKNSYQKVFHIGYKERSLIFKNQEIISLCK